MSQNSTTSTSSFFRPINSDDGDGESNARTTRLDKAVASVTDLQVSATTLKDSTKSIDSVIDTLNGIIFSGKTRSIASLNGLKCTLDGVGTRYFVLVLILDSTIKLSRYYNGYS